MEKRGYAYKVYELLGKRFYVYPKNAIISCAQIPRAVLESDSSADGVAETDGLITSLFNVISFRLPDIASWGGDLQTSYINYSDTIDQLPTSIETFKQILFTSNKGFGIDDFISDVDAINIGESYINYLGKRPSEALASYYSPKPQFSRFRYDQFPGNALEANGIGVNYSQIWSAFESRTYWDMRLEKNGAGELVSVPANLDRNPEHYLIQNDPSSNASKREKFAKCFLEYVKSKSVYGVGSC